MQIIQLHTIVSQLSKCLKFMPFREDVLSYAIECKYSSEALETFYRHQFYKTRNKIISEPFCEQQYTHASYYISLFKFKSFDQLIPPKLPQILDIYSVVAL